ncbi:MAG TPA: FAD-dependent oxidoreductase [Spongiibacteraceae bacterium]|nr:FAD-dependent oxidoreductase [Spongiibacteraceae bacterium]
MIMQWDHSVDVVVVGSGAGGMTAALRAAHAGLDVLIVEKAATYGGTSATSGGGLWVPCNHLMPAVGIADSEEDARSYLQSLTGDEVPADNVEAFVQHARRMLAWLEAHSEVRYMAMEHYADYYQEIAGAKPGGRSIDPLPYDARLLGDDFLAMQAPHQQMRVMNLMGYTNLEGAVLLSKAPGWFKLILSLVWTYAKDIPWRLRSRRSRRLTMGNALIGRLRRSLLDRDVALWLNTPAQALVEEQGRVVGVTVRHEGTEKQIEARCGVVLASGGFEHSQALRERYLPRPTRTSWSSASPANTGDMLVAAQAIGARTALLDEAWWGPSITVRGEDRSRQLFSERSMPGCIMVNRRGARFFNESVCYTSAVQAMFEADNLPAYVIFDSRYKREYPFGPLLPGGMHLNWLQPGVSRTLLTRADTIEGLAAKLGIDSEGLSATVQRFNGFAKTGTDTDFQRGEAAYDLIYGDVRLGPNPCLAAIEEGPFYGMEVYPGDIGTKGGVLTNPDAQVLRENGEVIPGLYATGNCSASVTGRYYPGAGATLGPAMTFGFLAAEHMIGERGKQQPSG